jgi:Universal stress protein UspA and related nucleotide-binding proteins
MHDIPPSVMPSAPSSDRSFRRILVALDASPHSRAALDLAVQLAADLEADLEGLFVKDENLIRAAQLPFAAEVRTHSVSPKALNDRRVQRRLRRQSDQAEAVLQAATEQAPVSYDFRVVEGQVTRQLLRAAEEADLVALGKTSTQSSRRRLGTTSEALLAESSTPVLVLRRAPRRRPPPSVLRRFGDGPAGPAHGGRARGSRHPSHGVCARGERDTDRTPARRGARRPRHAPRTDPGAPPHAGRSGPARRPCPPTRPGALRDARHRLATGRRVPPALSV